MRRRRLQQDPARVDRHGVHGNHDEHGEEEGRDAVGKVDVAAKVIKCHKSSKKLI